MGAGSEDLSPQPLPNDLLRLQDDPFFWAKARQQIWAAITPPAVRETLEHAQAEYGLTLDTHLVNCGGYGLIQVIYGLDARRTPILNQPMKTDITYNPKADTVTIQSPRNDPNRTFNPLSCFFVQYFPNLDTAKIVTFDHSLHATPASALAHHDDPSHPTTAIFLSPYVHTLAGESVVRALGGKPSTTPFNAKFAAIIITTRPS